jgi:hypothetical protein
MGDLLEQQRAAAPRVDDAAPAELEPPASFPLGSGVLTIYEDDDADGIRLLLVGPDDARRALLRETLEEAGYGVIPARDADEVSRILATTMLYVAIATRVTPELEGALAAAPEVPLVRCDAEPIRGLLLLTAVRDAIRARYA